MPPAAKFTREQIIEAAFGLVRVQGMASLTARSLGEALGTSATPVFTVFRSIEEVREAVLAKARELYRAYVEEGLQETPSFKGVGMQYIRFAALEPQLFRLLFLRPNRPWAAEMTGILPVMDDNYEQILASFTEFYGLDRNDGARIYEHLGIYAHGLAAVCATGVARYDEEEVSRRLTEVFMAVLEADRKGERKTC